MMYDLIPLGLGQPHTDKLPLRLLRRRRLLIFLFYAIPARLILTAC